MCIRDRFGELFRDASIATDLVKGCNLGHVMNIMYLVSFNRSRVLVVFGRESGQV